MHKNLPAGKYFLGDPCYCFISHDVWDKLLTDTDFFNRNSKEWPLIAASNTKYGDGVYIRSNDDEIPVDSGLIGCCHSSYWETSEEYLHNMGSIIEMNDEFTFIAEDGRFYINTTLEIDTQ